MESFGKFPWKKINDFLMEIGNERDPFQFRVSVMKRIASLVPYDTGILFLVDEARKSVETVRIGIEDEWIKAYLSYYSKVDGGRFSFETADIGEIHWSDYKDTEYVSDFVRPQRYDSSATVKFFDDRGGLAGAMSLNRSGHNGFGEREKDVLRTVRPHIANLHANMFVSSATRSVPDSSDPRSLLTRREKEILDLLCLGLPPREVGVRLFISPRTVEKHVESIHRKLSVNSRQALIVKMLSSPS